MAHTYLRLVGCYLSFKMSGKLKVEVTQQHKTGICIGNSKNEVREIQYIEKDKRSIKSIPELWL